MRRVEGENKMDDEDEEGAKKRWKGRKS